MAMAGLQRSAVSFRRQGSSGSIWDDKFLNELNQMANKKPDTTKSDEVSHPHPDRKEEEGITRSKDEPSVPAMERSRSTGGIRTFRTGKVSPAMVDPPSPKVSACGFCTAFGKQDKSHRRPNSGKRKL